MTTKQTAQPYLLIETMEGDEVTPIVLYHRLQGKKKFLLESSLSKEDKGRYSFIGCNPYLELKSHGSAVELIYEDRTETREGRVLEAIREVLPFHEIDSPFPFSGGAVGYVGYDVIRQYEQLGDINEDLLEMPEAHLMFYQTFLVYDHKLQQVSFVYVYRPDEERSEEEARGLLREMRAQILKGGMVEAQTADLHATFTSNVTKDEFCGMVEKAKEYIRAGDIFQVVLSQRLTASFQGNPFGLYRRLRVTNPSPYMFFVDFGDYIVLGSSPESLLAVRGSKVTTNPIAGTRPRGKTPEADRSIEKELLANEKEKAEHLMLVDLGRNDIGFISEIGTVQLEKFMAVERYSHVMHLVSEVSGELKPGMTCFDALAFCLPAGTVSGAPKIRAMTIIDELENCKRNVYAGTVGYISFTGDMDMALAIRTMVVKDQQAYIQAGAGVVYDSDPEAEYEETMNKARALLEVMR
ncbi:anthranilate synthase component I [Ectobacillus ponti]|uniref:Anthranilate synthase component 1 n=1 Tax=Ectobacillus ponti TaxID=2961894 RepID=A0AA42BSE9_9BACI|nr:anthranilate synthase component I [Ectobacillus ponti]MCP8968368.1 anthranilate synthase component I [Ectobacillus ponti]